MKKAHKNATYCSKTTQNEIIDILGGMISEPIVNEVKDAPFFSVIADKVRDVSCTEQISLVL